MAIQVVPESQTPGKAFANQLATGLGSQLGKLAGQGIGAAASKFGEFTGLTEGPKKLTKAALVGAGFSEADADLILQAPAPIQFKLIEAISQRPPTEQPQQKMAPNEVEVEQEIPEMEGINPDFAKRYQAVTGKSLASTMPQEEIAAEVVPGQGAMIEEKMVQPKVSPKEQPKSALFRPTTKQLEQEKRREEYTNREEEKLDIQKKKVMLQEKEAERRAERELTKEERIEQHHIDKETKPFFTDVKKSAKAGKENKIRLDRMETLIDEGRLTNPGFASMLETLSHGLFGFGIDLYSLTDPSTQEFRKISNDFVKSAKDIFGSRLTDADLKVFLSTVPTLTQSDETKRRVIHNLRIFADGAEARNKAMEEIIAENGGRRPRNLEDLTEKREKSILDRLAKEYKEGLPTAAGIHETIKQGGSQNKGLPLTDVESEYL